MYLYNCQHQTKNCLKVFLIVPCLQTSVPEPHYWLRSQVLLHSPSSTTLSVQVACTESDECCDGGLGTGGTLHNRIDNVEMHNFFSEGKICSLACYQPLQALLSCPGMYNLLKSVSPFPTLSHTPTATPLTDSMYVHWCLTIHINYLRNCSHFSSSLPAS